MIQRFEMLMSQVIDGQVARTHVFTPGQAVSTIGDAEGLTVLLEQGWEPCGFHSIPSEDAKVGLIFVIFKRRIPLGDFPELDAVEEPKVGSKEWVAKRLGKET